VGWVGGEVPLGRSRMWRKADRAWVLTQYLWHAGVGPQGSWVGLGPATLVIDCLIEAHGWQSPNQPSETPLAAQKRQCAFCRQRVPIRLTLPWGGRGGFFGIPGALSVFSTEEWGKKRTPTTTGNLVVLRNHPRRARAIAWRDTKQ
jgi:hypothetical protein